MRKNERTVGFYNIKITASSIDHPAPRALAVKDALTLIANLEKTDRHLMRRGAAVAHGLGDIVVGETEAELLFYRSDKNKSDPIFLDHDSIISREVNKSDQEGDNSSVHCLIRYGQGGQFPAMLYLEQAAGLGATRIITMLGQLLRRARVKRPDWFLQQHPTRQESGRPVFVRVKYGFEITGIVSDRLAADLEAGVLTNLELVSDGRMHAELGEDPYFEERLNVVHLKVKDGAGGVSGKLVNIQRVLGLKRLEYQKARIRFKTAGGTPQSVAWSAQEGIEQEWVKKELIKPISPPMRAAYGEIYKPFMNLVKSLADRYDASNTPPP